MKNVFILFGVLLMAGCSGPSIGSFQTFRAMEPKVKEIDVAELAANLEPGQAAFFQYRYRSMAPDLTETFGAEGEITAEALVKAMAAGAEMASSAASQGWEAAFRDAINKNRDMDVFLSIMESDHMRDVMLGKSANQIKPGQLLRDRWVQLTATNDTVVGLIGPQVEGSPSDPAVEPVESAREAGPDQIRVIDDAESYLIILPSARTWSRYRIREHTGRETNGIYTDGKDQWVVIPRSMADSDGGVIIDLYPSLTDDESFTVYDASKGSGIYDYSADSPLKL